MLSPRKALKVGKLWLQYGLKSDENKRKIAEVLNEEFKPLFGIKGTVYLLPHGHASQFIREELWKSLHTKDRERIDKFLKDGDEYVRATHGYRKDMDAILEILSVTDISTIYMEATAEDAQSRLDELPRSYNSLTRDLQKLWYSSYVCNQVSLYLFGWVGKLYLEGKLNWISIVWMEGPSKLICNEYMRRTQGKDWENPEHIRIVVTDRDKEMVENLTKATATNSIAVYGTSHHKWIKNGLEKNSFRTNSKHLKCEATRLQINMQF